MSVAKYLPPEGGWGYAVAFGYSLMFICAIGPLQAFGLIYGDFLRNLGDEATATTIINCVFSIVSSFMGIGAKPLLNNFSLRKVGVAGACFFTLGSYLCIFVRSIPQLVFTYAVLQGIGFGLMLPVTMTSLNNYFIKKSSLMTAMAQTGICAGAICIPFFFKIIMETFGYKGTLVLIAACSSNTFVAMMLMRPVEWYMVPNPEIELLTPHENGADKKTHESGTRRESENLMVDEHKDDESDANSLREYRDMVQASGLNINASLPDITVAMHPKKKGAIKEIIESLDLTLFKDIIYVNMAFGMALTFSADLVVQTLAPLLLLNKGFDTEDIAICLTITAASDLTSRILLTAISFFITLRGRYVVLAGSIFTICFRTVFAYIDQFTAVAIMSSGIGFMRSWIQVQMPVVFAEHFSQERFPAAWGLFMVVSGLINVFIGLAIGVVSNATKSDTYILHALTGFSLLCVVPWLIEVIFCHKRSIERKT